MFSPHTSEMDASDQPLVILLPVFNDWLAAQSLLGQLDRVLTESSIEARVLIVNDGSREAPAVGFPGHNFKALSYVDILHL